MMNLNALKIDPEFQGKIPPLNFEEEQQLEQNILHEGRLLNPIIIWNGFILDGHTRYRILRKHPFIVYQIQEIELANRYAALSWICQNQLGRRNLDPERKKFLMGKLYESEKLARGGSKERAHDENGRFTSMVQNDPLRAKQLSTCERIAAQNGVGAATVKRAEKYAKGVDAAEDAVPGAREDPDRAHQGNGRRNHRLGKNAKSRNSCCSCRIAEAKAGTSAPKSRNIFFKTNAF